MCVKDLHNQALWKSYTTLTTLNMLDKGARGGGCKKPRYELI